MVRVNPSNPIKPSLSTGYMHTLCMHAEIISSYSSSESNNNHAMKIFPRQILSSVYFFSMPQNAPKCAIEHLKLPKFPWGALPQTSLSEKLQLISSALPRCVYGYMPSILCSNYKGLPCLPHVFSAEKRDHQDDLSVYTIMTKVNIVQCNRVQFYIVYRFCGYANCIVLRTCMVVWLPGPLIGRSGVSS